MQQQLAQYSDRLAGVRYRYDAQRKKRFKTVEVIVAAHSGNHPRRVLPRTQRWAVRVGFTEVALQEQVKQVGGTWHRSPKVRELHYERVVALKLEARIVEEASHTIDVQKKIRERDGMDWTKHERSGMPIAWHPNHAPLGRRYLS